MQVRTASKNSQRTPVFPVPVHEPVKFAFDIADKTYWKYPDIFKTPSLRGLQAMVFYDELNKRTSKALYQEELDAELILLQKIRYAISGEAGKINLGDAFTAIGDWEKILNYRKERMMFIVEPDLVWKLASIVYFDETENPHRYDMAYNLEIKIPFWKESVTEHDFFFSKPVKELIPYMEEYEQNFQTYSQVIRMVREIHSNHLSSIKSNL